MDKSTPVPRLNRFQCGHKHNNAIMN